MAGYSRNRSYCWIFIAITIFILQKASSQHPPTCTGLEQFVTNTNKSLTTCERDAACSMVSCNTVGSFAATIVSSKVTLLSCTQPPSVNLVVTGVNDRVLFDGVLSSSGTVHLLQDISFVGPTQVTTNVSILLVLNNSIETEIGLEADLHTEVIDPAIPMPTSTMTINGYTRIPLDIPSCVTMSMPPNTSTTDFVTTTSSASGTVVGAGKRHLRTFILCISLLLCYLTLDRIPSR